MPASPPPRDRLPAGASARWTGARASSRLRGALLAFALIAASPTFAQRPAPVLHEPLPSSLAGGRSDRVVRARPGERLPSAIDTAAGRIDRPAAPEGASKPAPRYLPPPAQGTRPPPRIKADARTGREGRLHYRVVFNPSVAPFKRDLAFDQVTPAGELAMSGVGLKPVRARGDKARAGHELFWGHVTLDLAPGRKTPLPSVAPTSAVLSWQASPPVPLTFWRDQAGNLSVSTTAKTKRVDLRFLMDAPSRYFGTPLSAGPVRDDPWTPTLAPALQAQIATLWPAIGVSPNASRAQNLGALATWFRAFVPGPGPKPGPALVSELVLGQRGVCRHRALGLVIVAHSLGIPALYVMNDAHAFAEVWAPSSAGGGGWVRMDLGGGADELQLHAAENKRLHQPLFRDPFPQPKSYARQTGRVEGAGGGPGSWAGAQKVRGAESFAPRPAPGQGAAAAKAPQPGAASEPGGAPAAAAAQQAKASPESAERKAWLRRRAQALAAPRTPPGADRQTPQPPGAPSPPPDPRAPTRVHFRASAQAWVGEVLKLSGRLEGPAKKVAKQPLEVWLVRPRDPNDGRQIGTAVTGKGGRFNAKVAIPLDARLGVWDLVVRFPGTRSLRPSFSTER